MSRKNKSTRGPGRPRLDVCKKFKSVSVPEDLWNECHEIAKKHGVTPGRVVWSRIKNGKYDPEDEKEGDELGYEFEG